MLFKLNSQFHTVGIQVLSSMNQKPHTLREINKNLYELPSSTTPKLLFRILKLYYNQKVASLMALHEQIGYKVQDERARGW